MKRNRHWAPRSRSTCSACSRGQSQCTLCWKCPSLIEISPPPSQQPSMTQSSSFQSQSHNSSSASHDPIMAASSQQPLPKASASDSSSRPSSATVQVPEPRSAMPAKPSPFDFVSPFDAFDRPAPKSALSSSAEPSKSQNQQTAAAPEPKAKSQQTKQAFSIPPAHINGTVIHPGDAAASTKPASSFSPSTSHKAQLPQSGDGLPSSSIGTGVRPESQQARSAQSDTRGQAGQG